MKLSFLIVDDERLSRDYIKDLIGEFEPSANISEVSSSKAAISILEKGETDVLFLDIKMPELNGFELLHTVSNKNFDLIFTTAYSEYAIKAIKEGAFDYLLKPIKKIEFKKTLERVVKKRQDDLDHTQLFHEKNYLDNTLALSSQRNIKMVKLKDIIYLKADNTYTTIYLSDGSKITTSKPINRYEDLLDPSYFFRIHKSYIISMHHCKEYRSKEGDVAVMDNDQELIISRYRLSAFMQLLNTATGLKI